jgi:DNA-binding HxlR family transcriptional regulator
MAAARKLSQEHTSAACDRGTAALGRAFEFLGKRWNGVLLGTLRNGPAGFRELSRAVDGISDSVLSDRLSDLAAAGLVTRTVDEGPPLAVSYALTDRGTALLPALAQITLWAEEHLVQHTQPGIAPRRVATERPS